MADPVLFTSKPVLPFLSLADAQKKFTALGEDWWKPFYDGKFHDLGPEVFDKGRHNRDKEPGFYDSLRKAFLFAKEHLCEKLTVEFYQNLNRIACAHFKGKETCTKMDAKDAGRFRKLDESECCTIGLRDFLKIHEPGKETLIDEYVRAKFKLNSNPPMTQEDLKKIGMQNLTIEDFQYFANAADVHFSNLVKFINDIEKDPLLKEKMPVLKLWFDLKLFYSDISKVRNFSYEEVIGTLFDTFNRKIARVEDELQEPDCAREEELIQEKKRLIADLFQKIEFLHPYIDGQGRTDLLLLTWLLCSHGLNPAILNDPYVSSFTTLDNWIAYLNEGMRAWAREAQAK
jgi:prophage maintenance system killer protein